MTPQNKTFDLVPIGYTHQSDMGFQIEILEPYRPALKNLGQFSHAKIYWWADKNDTAEMRANLQAELPYAPGVIAGVFACRAEYRPNPIAETTCFIIDIDEINGVITVPWIDAFDGTPILDIKPYIPISDRVRDVEVPEWLSMLPAFMEDAAEFFADEGADFFD